ncbi:MAG TPA: hypothetical protein VNT33_08445 [Telluria sp.]|nr:hypothetical protein [Telluria sp.]
MKRSLKTLAFAAIWAATLPAMAQITASIQQDGSLGTATIFQDAGLRPFEASIVQRSGVANRATLSQSGNDAHVAITQSGDRHVAEVAQQVDGGHVTVLQGSGAGNVANVSQLGTLSGIANVQQLGSNNQVLIDQNAFVVRADVTQSGTGNQARVIQRGVMNQTVSVDQHGTNHRADVEVIDNASASIVQRGSDHVAILRGYGAQFVVEQEGTANEADITLDGQGSSGTIHQHGTGNKGFIVSVGDGNVATIRQGGENNVARIDQNGGGLTATILQNTRSPGYGNIASIIQRH